MIYINENIQSKIDSITYDNLYIVTDFDSTITAGNSESSWGILSKSDLVPKQYVKERQELYNYYRPFEFDSSLDFETRSNLMYEWWNKHISLFLKYQLSEEVINKAASDLRVMEFRDGAKEFLDKMSENNIPIIIISAGIGNFVEQFLVKNNCNYDNIYIVANFIRFKDGTAIGMSNNVIHSLNKNEVSLPKEIKEKVANRKNILLLGDLVADIKMVSEEKRDHTLRIGFLEADVEEYMEQYKESFDIVCTNNTSYKELLKILKIPNFS
ncbi:MAG: haloacid dehalogenase-like hydrolase [Oscillospiraceae bacterium]|nr:haloacid dehalogenase-like hydrolase [Oscillospiraceae bacterium]